MPKQFAIDFSGLPAPNLGQRPITPANSDTRSLAMRRHVQENRLSDSSLRFISFGSGSSGNSYYLGNSAGSGVIIDAGVKAEIIETTMRANGLNMDKLEGILLTHDHTDHSKYVYALLKAHKHLHLYCTPRVLNALLRRHSISRRVKDYHMAIYKEFPFRLAEMEITAFDVPHDAADTSGFQFRLRDKVFAIATDIGEVQERAYHYLSQANYMVIEANYDSHMLAIGPYPEHLKARIRTSHGHLDNVDTARFLSEIAGNQLHRVWLCHLSRDNNHPQIALKTIREALENKGFTVGSGQETLSDLKADLQLEALPRFEPTHLYVLR
jgi:phosphoribosyl 1,2-cyclic phosphodiesterase